MAEHHELKASQAEAVSVVTTETKQHSGSDAPLEGSAALDLYLAELGSSVAAITEQSALLLQALAERSGQPRPQLTTCRRRKPDGHHQSRVALRHPPGPAPALQRGPQAAVESEAVDRRRGGDRVDAQQHHAVPLEAALFQDTARGRVRHPCASLEPLEAEILEGVVDQGARRLGGIPSQ